MVIFTSSPAGLGHIRVLDAIKDGAPTKSSLNDVGMENTTESRLHFSGSNVKFFAWLTHFYQTNPIAEFIVTKIYTFYLRINADQAINVFSKIAADNPEEKKWVVISTHFALAHTIAAAKHKLEEKLGITIALFEVVTDDSPQRVWAVNGADRIFVPSEQTKTKLAKYLKNPEVLRVISYPISPRLGEALTDAEFDLVKNQLAPHSRETTIDIPISGAGTQLPFFENLIKNLIPHGFKFKIVGLDLPFNRAFIAKMKQVPQVELLVGVSPWETVHIYESMFQKSPRPAIEITKPSENCFKSLLEPKTRGGMIILLTPPIGRQEFDNLNFLVRHRLMPTADEQVKLENGEIDNDIHYKASHWRAIRLPTDAAKATEFIKKLKESGIFGTMLGFVAEEQQELRHDGVRMIWEEVNSSLS